MKALDYRYLVLNLLNTQEVLKFTTRQGVDTFFETRKGMYRVFADTPDIRRLDDEDERPVIPVRRTKRKPIIPTPDIEGAPSGDGFLELDEVYDDEV